VFAIALPYKLICPGFFLHLSALSRQSVGDLTYCREAELRFCPEYLGGIFAHAILDSVLDAIVDLEASWRLCSVDLSSATFSSLICPHTFQCPWNHIRR
jgi:hypothetical protein